MIAYLQPTTSWTFDPLQIVPTLLWVDPYLVQTPLVQPILVQPFPTIGPN